jgi:hypothetical protein
MHDVMRMDGAYLDVMRLHKEGFCCSQIMAIMLLEEINGSNEGLIKAMAGLCNGVGASGEVCGCLSGGACLIALCAAKGSDGGGRHPMLSLMLEELADWFREKTAMPFGGMRCDDILGVSPDRKACIGLAADTYERLVSILRTYGFIAGPT